MTSPIFGRMKNCTGYRDSGATAGGGARNGRFGKPADRSCEILVGDKVIGEIITVRHYSDCTPEQVIYTDRYEVTVHQWDGSTKTRFDVDYDQDGDGAPRVALKAAKAWAASIHNASIVRYCRCGDGRPYGQLDLFTDPNNLA